MKRIGVVIPIYNTEKYLRQCIESVLAQNYENMAIALVDDGSTDNCGKICDEYAKKDNRITVIHQENSDMIAARYRGATAIDYDYLTFVDSDDWIAPNAYEKFTEQMESDIDLIVWQYIRYNNENNQTIVRHSFTCGFYDNERYKKEFYPNMIWNFEKKGQGINTSIWNKLIKKSLALKFMKMAQSIKNITYGEDMAVLFPMLKEVKTLYLSGENLYYYRQKENSEIPAYFKDINFFKKFSVLYYYILQFYKDDPNIIKQLDILYENNINLRNKNFFPQKNKPNIFIFPFNKITVGKNIIIYGAGTIGKNYYKEVTMLNYANKILWVDKNYLSYQELGVKNIECLKTAIDYDYIVIAIENKKIVKEVIDHLSAIPILNNIKIISDVYKYQI